MSTPSIEKIINNQEIILNELFPKTEYEGSFITAENTIEGLFGKVKADEETDIVVCNKNLAKIRENSWKLTNSNTIKNLYQNAGSNLIYPITLKAGQKIIFSIKMISVPSTDTTLSFYIDGNSSSLIKTYQSINSFTLNEIVNREYTAEEDCEITIKEWGNSASDTFEFQFWAELEESTTEYTVHEEQTYTGTNIEFKTYDGITHIYNTDDVNMTATVRTKNE